MRYFSVFTGIRRFGFMTMILLLTGAPLLAQHYPEPVVDSLWSNGIESIISERYSDAQNTFTRLENDYPALPIGSIYLAAVEIVKAYDYGMVYKDTYIMNKLGGALLLAESNLDSEESLWNFYFLGLVNAYYAYYAALNEDWFSAFDSGLDAIDSFEECLRINPDFYEAMIAVCSYKYWKSVKMDWLPVIEDERAYAVNCLEKYALKSTYNEYLAVNSLLWIYIDAGQNEKAVELLEPVIEKYPESRFFKWGFARVYEEIDRKKANEIYRDILHSYEKQNIRTNIQIVTIKHKMAQNLARTGKNAEALSLCTEILAMNNLSEYEQNTLEERLERVTDLRDELVERISN